MRLYQNFLLLGFAAFIIIVTAILVVLEQNPQGNSLTGNAVVDTRVEVMPSQSKSCAFTMYEGWNMVSFYCFGMLVNRSLALESIDGSYVYAFKYQANDGSDPWKSYNPDLPNWTVQQLNYFDRISGYWIYMNETKNFSYFGISSSSSIQLYKGWNFIGYPKNSSQNISAAMAGLQYSIVTRYDNPMNTYLVYVNGGSGNTLTQFETYYGYWVNASQNGQLNIT